MSQPAAFDAADPGRMIEAMDPHAQIQRHELTVPRFGLGCAPRGNLFRERDDDQVQKVLEAAWDCGIRHFDTAPHYGLGLSERRLGKFLCAKPRDEFVISTKVGRLIRDNPGWDGTALDDDGFVVPASQHRVLD